MSMYSADKIVENFDFIGVSPDDGVIAKCLELCISYKLSEEDLVDVWAAFSISNLKNAPPTLEGLDLLERKDLSKNKGSLSSVPVVEAPERKKPISKVNNSYSSPGAASAKTPQSQKTLTQTLNDRFTQDIISTDTSAFQVGNYADRANPGKVVLAFPPNEKSNYSQCMAPVHIKLFGDEHQWLLANAQHMYCSVNKQRECQAGITEYVARMIAEKHRITLDSYFDRNSTEGTYFGTIVCDGNGRLNKTSAMLELPEGDYSNGDKVLLNLSQLATYSLFPGQVAVVQGKFIKGTLQVSNLYNDAFISPRQILETGSVQIIAASGPFTSKNNLLYEPLQDLLKTVLDVRPHVLILSGPFLEYDNSNITTMTEAFDSFFCTLIESIMDPLNGTEIKVVLVSSLKDVHHFPVYPTPPYDIPARYPNLVCVPDPAILDIDGLHIAVTTADILFNIATEDLSWPPGSIDRMSRLSQYLLNQLSFYPLQSADPKLPIDYSFLERYGLMETPPHLLIVPSNFRHFIKKISGCTVINPERLVKGYAGGTYARIQISTSKELKVSCEIVNI